jgi:hypothetical protein
VSRRIRLLAHLTLEFFHHCHIATATATAADVAFKFNTNLLIWFVLGPALRLLRIAYYNY